MKDKRQSLRQMQSQIFFHNSTNKIASKITTAAVGPAKTTSLATKIFNNDLKQQSTTTCNIIYNNNSNNIQNDL